MRRPGGEEWPKLIAEYVTSGQSQKEFCADRGLSFNTFQYWLKAVLYFETFQGRFILFCGKLATNFL